jgi:microcystin degradation protein MlrC
VKRPLLIAPEAQGSDGPLGRVRRLADERLKNGCQDVSLFPVQPWLDVDELGFGVTVTTDNDTDRAEAVAEEIASLAWEIRGEFRVPLAEPKEALERARRTLRRPVVLSESADSPTSGTPADSPAMVRELLAHGRDLRSAVTLVDARAVAACQGVGIGGAFAGEVGCSLERRFHQPVHLSGVVNRLGGGSFELTGPAFTGMTVSMGDYAVVTAAKAQVLLTTRPAPTFDPQAYRVAGIEVEDLDVVVVRSANLFRAAYADISSECIILDLPGASTPRLESLPFTRAPRPMYPLDQ